MVWLSLGGNFFVGVYMRQSVPRTWLEFDYFDSRDTLVRLGSIQKSLVGVPIEDRVLRLRTRLLRSDHERRQAALFCYGLSCHLDRPVAFAHIEDQDFDCVATWVEAGVTQFPAIQLKELPPGYLNPHTSLEVEIAKLSKYVAGSDLFVAFYLNREFHLDLSELKIPKLPIAGLWLFGGIDPYQTRWMLWGDLLGELKSTEFQYP